MGNQNHSLGFTKMSNILHKRYVKWNKIGSTSFTLDLLPIAEFRSEPWARVHLSKWSPNSSPSLSSLGPLWSACWWVSTPWVQAVCPLRTHPFPISFPVPIKVPLTKHRYILGNREAGFKEDTRIPTGSSEALLLWTPASTRCNLLLPRYCLVVQSSFSVMLLLTRKCAEHPSSIPFILSFSNTHTPSPGKVFYTPAFPL